MTTTGPGLVFIVGVGRSGTSLLQTMLHSHPEVCFIPEINFIRRFLATDDLDKLWARDRDAAAEKLGSDDLISRLELGHDQIQEILDGLGDGFSTPVFYRQLLEAVAKQSKDDVRWVGDKDPRSVEYLRVLHHQFPDARVLHIVRDPRDVLSSKKKAAWSRDHSPLRHIFANRVQLKMGREQGRQLFGTQYLEFAYEELIADPVSVLERICSFLEIDFDSSMLDFSGNGEIFVSQEEMQWKKETLGPLLPNNAGKWKLELTPWEAALTERVCGEAFSTMHYEKGGSAAELGLWRRLALGPVSALFAALDPLYRFHRKRKDSVSDRSHT